ncbi:endonuclease domain-containing protein [uncultured Phenylobacterium sp.]|uniref:endonuclease domain-containing protein n=1 Tax=uncultured Phenylobacterium sp. TaxID=349273 RepID=UPI0025F6F783|nr:endonuclease domain-containing protein [uncultured Phenylobacterium sp.]
MARWNTTSTPTPRPTKDFAKSLRRSMSLPEVLLWQALKGGGLEGLRFRKQHPIGPYILDFYCARLRLAVEVDGGSHGFGDRPDRDERRDAWLREQGIHTLRMSASLVLESVDDALRTILGEVEAMGRGDALPFNPLRPFGPPPPAREDR